MRKDFTLYLESHYSDSNFIIYQYKRPVHFAKKSFENVCLHKFGKEKILLKNSTGFSFFCCSKSAFLVRVVVYLLQSKYKLGNEDFTHYYSMPNCDLC